MKTRYLLPVLIVAILTCSACAGGTNRRPSLNQPPSGEQEYRRETHVKNNPGSLFAASEQDTLFSDSRARRVGDIVVVKLVENTKAQNKAETTANKKSGSSYDVPSMFGKSKVGFVPFFAMGPQANVGENPFLQSDSSSNLSGTGKTKRENYVTTSLAARVLRVLPGGLLEIEGAREIRVNEETEYMVVRGMARAKDVDADNSILSTQLADASIQYYGKGVLSDKQKPGWFTRLMDNIWPF